jgi:hypothetical protein
MLDVAKLLTRDEARRIAANIAKLWSYWQVLTRSIWRAGCSVAGFDRVMAACVLLR